MNESPLNLKKGTIGELLIQLRLLQYGIEPAIPLIDSGNDIIALKGRTVKSIQVKTKKFDRRIWRLDNMPERYDILALVKLAEDWENLDHAKIYLLSERDVNNRGSISDNERVLEDYRLSIERINLLFSSRD